MKLKAQYHKHIFVPLLLIIITGLSSAANKPHRQSGVFGEPGHIRISPYLFDGFSRKNLYFNRSGSGYGYSILNCARNKTDSLKIIALRVEFQSDSSYLTTGNGLFGILRPNSKGIREDRNEWDYYYGKNAYAYDKLPHDSLYFAHHLEFVKKYFWKVSRGRLFIDYTVYPKGKEEWHAYQVPDKMPKYSPGAKKKKESWDEYYLRRTVGLMSFIRDAIKAGDNSADSPFKNVIADNSGGRNVFYEISIDSATGDTIKHRAAILIFHAGASYLTDGGWDGYFGQDTPSDMIDAFVSTEFFDYFAKDTSIHLDTAAGSAGVMVNKNLPNQLIVDEVMMVSETSNQDSLNWGINGILVNQIARQLGIPDLFSTMSGISGIGAFCIMDFAGYSAGRGFIPPLPSAWVRAYMGWDEPKIIEPGNPRTLATLSALYAASSGDTTIALIPINNHEYYLIENRQRNLSGDTSLFNYDTLEDFDDPQLSNPVVISPYDQVNLQKNIISTFPTASAVIDSVYNFDISIPASGLCIWHIDEYIIRDHLQQNVLNADSSYRGISLEEADGVVDLGVMFRNIFYQAIFDYGGAADVFPHFSWKNKDTVDAMGPFTRPSTNSNDGGHTYLKIGIAPKHPSSRNEISVVEGDLVYNIADTSFVITLERGDTASLSGLPNWPERIMPAKFFEPLVCDVYANGSSREIAVLDTSGRLYIFPANGDDTLFCPVKEALPSLLYTNDTVYTDSVSYCAKIPAPAGMPTCIDTSVYIPSKDGHLYILRSIDSAQALWDTINLSHPASSYICNYASTEWAVGCSNGVVMFGDDATNTVTAVTPLSNGAIQALAVLNPQKKTLAGINAQGVLLVLSDNGILDSIHLSATKGTPVFPPFTLATADLDQDSTFDIVVSDRKQGVWLYNFDETENRLSLDKNWIGWPNDWAGAHRYDTSRAAIPDNESAPSIADLDGDNILDIIIGGTNGIYAYNTRGILLVQWPGLLDTRYWYQRGSILASPVIGIEPKNSEPLVIFSSPTGENLTWAVAHIDSTNVKTGTIYFTRTDGVHDSASGFTKSGIDSLLIIGDSLILPYVLPGGHVDAFNMHGKRPTTINTLTNVGKEIQSTWPLTVGGFIRTSPLLDDLDNNNKTDIVAVSEQGWIYRWEFSNSILKNSFVWQQAGSNGSRTFSYSGPVKPIAMGIKNAIEHFYNYPNPVKGASQTTFKYRLSKPATKVRLDVFTYTGFHIVSDQNLPAGFGWNEHTISVKKFGSAIYRCRLEADFNGTKKVKYWKMAIMK